MKPTKSDISSVIQERDKQAHGPRTSKQPSNVGRRSPTSKKHDLPLLLFETGVDDKRREVAQIQEAVQLNSPVHLRAEDHNLTDRYGVQNDIKNHYTNSWSEKDSRASPGMIRNPPIYENVLTHVNTVIAKDHATRKVPTGKEQLDTDPATMIGY